jgi:hypothetical protein
VCLVLVWHEKTRQEKRESAIAAIAGDVKEANMFRYGKKVVVFLLSCSDLDIRITAMTLTTQAWTRENEEEGKVARFDEDQRHDFILSASAAGGLDEVEIHNIK